MRLSPVFGSVWPALIDSKRKASSQSRSCHVESNHRGHSLEQWSVLVLDVFEVVRPQACLHLTNTLLLSAKGHRTDKPVKGLKLFDRIAFNAGAYVVSDDGV